ncbi:flavin-containing monooxygenase [Bulinus truncatus]|nr:flavin-containing monooxygenase [Bulinus truncatus]
MSSNLSSKNGCIVGAGASGLVALKECIQCGLRPVCYELGTDIGGVWMEKCDGPSNTPRLWPSLFTNTTKYMMTFSDFPPLPEDTPYLTAKSFRDYYKRYALKFDLVKYIKFSTRVVKLPNLVFRDIIAKLLGVYPSFWSLLLKDPHFANQSWYGPSYSAQYRLLGPGSDWAKAKETCYTAGREGMTSLLRGDSCSGQIDVTTDFSWTKLMFRYFILPAAVTVFFFTFKKSAKVN